MLKSISKHIARARKSSTFSSTDGIKKMQTRHSALEFLTVTMGEISKLENFLKMGNIAV